MSSFQDQKREKQYQEYRSKIEKKESSRFTKAVAKSHVKKKSKPIQWSQNEAPKYVFGMKKEFYQTREWRKIRWEVLRGNDNHCVLCGRGREHGVILHVDHIKPRSKFPTLELVKDNLQILCEDCNIGKGNSI